MAIVIQSKNIENNMEEFLKYFKENMMDMNKVNKGILDTAFYILYSKTRHGSSCTTCLQNVYYNLLDVYDHNVKPVIEEVVVETPKKKNSK